VDLTTPVVVPAGQTVGFYLVGRLGGIRTASTGPTNFGNSDLSMFTSDAKTFALANAPGWATNNLATQRSFNGRVYYTVVRPCYANCDGSVAPPRAQRQRLPVLPERVCRWRQPTQTAMVRPAQPVLNANDFQCFLNAFAIGCT